MSPSHRGQSTGCFSFVFLGLVIPMAMPGVAATTQDVAVEAVAGEPFGVAKVTFPAPAAARGFSLAGGDFQLAQADGRALYPALVANDPVRFYFLFPGAGAFDITFHTPGAHAVTVKPKVPADDDESHARLLKEWWQALLSRSSFRHR